MIYKFFKHGKEIDEINGDFEAALDRAFKETEADREEVAIFAMIGVTTTNRQGTIFRKVKK